MFLASPIIEMAVGSVKSVETSSINPRYSGDANAVIILIQHTTDNAREAVGEGDRRSNGGSREVSLDILGQVGINDFYLVGGVKKEERVFAQCQPWLIYKY